MGDYQEYLEMPAILLVPITTLVNYGKTEIPAFLRQGSLPCAGDKPALAGFALVHIDRFEIIEDR